MDVGSEARRAGCDRGNEHLPRTPGVAAHDQASSRSHELVGGCPPQRVGDGRPEVDVGDPAGSLQERVDQSNSAVELASSA